MCISHGTSSSLHSQLTLTGAENCSVLHYVFVRNRSDGIDVSLASAMINITITIPNVHLPSECGASYTQCNITSVHLDDGNITILIPVGGGILPLTCTYRGPNNNDNVIGWSPAPTAPCVLRASASCNPVAVGYVQGSTLPILSLRQSPDGSSDVITLGLDLCSDDVCLSSFVEIRAYSRAIPPSLSNPVLVEELANCLLLSVVATVVAFAAGPDFLLASLSPTPQAVLQSPSPWRCLPPGPSSLPRVLRRQVLHPERVHL